MKRKGFTLVELLAVIVILALIALIATPQILNVIESSRESSKRSSVDGIYSAIQIYYSDTMNYTGISRFSYKNNVLTCDANCGKENDIIPVSGSMGKDAIGWAYIDRDDTKVAIYTEGKCYYKINGSSSKTEEIEETACQEKLNDSK